MCAIASNIWQRYLLWFAHDLVDFRMAEIKSLISVLDINMRWVEEPADHPFWIVEVPSEECVKKLASRSISLRGVIELWAHSNNISTLHQQLKALNPNVYQPYLQPHLSFKVEVETFSNHLSLPELVDKIESFSYLPIVGPVNLKNPDVKLWFMEYYGLEPNNIPELPYQYYFGRWITDGQRHLMKKFSLKTRKFIGNTSMDAQISVLMANQGKVKPGDLVLDPFVGTGSLLVPAAHFGAYVLGTDIDYLILHAKTRPSRIQQKVRASDESIQANLRQYGLENQYIDVVVADSSLPLWVKEFELDAIITDPPYGIREPTERVGTHKVPQITEQQAPTHIPSKIDYGHDHLYQDLLNFAAKHLKLGGRLVTFIPILRELYNEENMPKHPCLELVANSEQVLSAYVCRRLLTYEKVSRPSDCMAGERTFDPSLENFRDKYFNHCEDSRQVRRQKHYSNIGLRDSNSKTDRIAPESDT
ncbi:tRNA (guanine(10)-N2)-methyltransferase homolog isoform X2 [Thrips palmi]|uniref:tRNA (guanine(10)-N(2))-methyltransferase TRMT11 n=1 Tax=Thrips palmi TaxID=161013 RepID=A0A6P9A0E9_THRPL|nr:tRNA (guanine(10)-N2)-methyltransferase homolog isoform X2 [Thrips palmi]